MMSKNKGPRILVEAFDTDNETLKQIHIDVIGVDPGTLAEVFRHESFGNNVRAHMTAAVSATLRSLRADQEREPARDLEQPAQP